MATRAMAQRGEDGPRMHMVGISPHGFLFNEKLGVRRGDVVVWVPTPDFALDINFGKRSPVAAKRLKAKKGRPIFALVTVEITIDNRFAYTVDGLTKLKARADPEIIVDGGGLVPDTPEDAAAARVQKADSKQKKASASSRKKR